MAVATWDNITAITREKILPGIEDQITKDNPTLFRLLKNGKRQDGGKTIDKVIRYALSTQGGAYTGLETLDTAQEKTRTRATWNWKQYHQPIVISNIDLAKNGGAEAVFKLLAEDTSDAGEAIRDKFGTALYTLRTGKAFDSLVDATGDNSIVTTYGGINRGNYSWWEGSAATGAGTLSLSMLATRYDDLKSGSNIPSIMVTHESEWSAYEALLQPQVRFNFAQQGYPKIDGGFQTMLFRGTPIVSDEYCTDGYMYFLNEKYLYFVTLKHPKYPTDKMGFIVTKMREPTDQDGAVGYILFYGNLICTQPRRQGVIRGIT